MIIINLPTATFSRGSCLYKVIPFLLRASSCPAPVLTSPGKFLPPQINDEPYVIPLLLRRRSCLAPVPTSPSKFLNHMSVVLVHITNKLLTYPDDFDYKPVLLLLRQVLATMR